MRLRNGEHGYGLITKTLHWLTVVLVAGQFAVGLTMEADDRAVERADDRIDALEDAGEDAAQRHGDAAEDTFDDQIDRLRDELDAHDDDITSAFADVVSGSFWREGLSLPEIHVLLGVSLLVLGVVRVAWRRATPLPPWAPYLSAREEMLESVVEKLVLVSLFVVPLSGLLLVVDDGLLGVHIAAQLAFVLVIAVHVGLVLRHTVVRRNGQLRRML